MKKSIAIIMALVLSLSLLSISAFAADDYWCIAGTMNDWNANSSDRMTDNGDGTYTYTFANMAAGSYEFKFTKNGTWNYNLGGAFMGSGVESGLSQNGSNIKFTLEEANDVTIVLDATNQKFTLTIGGQIAEEPENITIHVSVPEDWGTAYAYCWNPESLGSWPGTAVTDGAVTLPAVFDGFIVNNGNGTQTVDITDINLTKEEVWITVAETPDESGKYPYTLSYEAPETPEAPAPEAPKLADGRYIISWEGKTFAALAEDKTYGYAPAGDVNALTEADYITITNVDGGFIMQDCYGRYIYMTGTYNSFNVSAELPEDGYVWTLVEVDGGHYIKNVLKEKHISFSAGYGTWGSYADPGDNSILTITAYTEPAPEVADITVHVIAEHWESVYAYVWTPEALGTWPGTLVENGSFVVEANFGGMVLSNGEGQQTTDITDIDLTKEEVWITVSETPDEAGKYTYTLSYEAPVVDPGTNPDGPITGDAILPGVLVLMLSVTGLVMLTTKKED